MLSLGLQIGVPGAGMKGSWPDTDTFQLETDAAWSSRHFSKSAFEYVSAGGLTGNSSRKIWRSCSSCLMDAIIWASFLANSCLIQKCYSRAFNSSLAGFSFCAISIFLLCTSSIFTWCSISFSCLSLAPLQLSKILMSSERRNAKIYGLTYQ